MSGLGALIMMGVCGLSGFFIIADERRGHGAEAAEVATIRPAVAVRDLGSRRADPLPLRVDEVFGQPEIAIVPGAEPYRVRMTHIDTDCHTATTGNLGDLLDRHGCSQVVRASMVAPIDDYLVTAGVFNLTDEAGATSVSAKIKPFVDGGRGSFGGLAVGLGGEPVAQPAAQVGWHTRGHYLVYCVIVRPDGEAVRAGDPYAQRIVFDLIESYLRDEVLARRAGLTS
jgi:hypothetical protein